jgi:hypothetical protein
VAGVLKGSGVRYPAKLHYTISTRQAQTVSELHKRRTSHREEDKTARTDSIVTTGRGSRRRRRCRGRQAGQDVLHPERLLVSVVGDREEVAPGKVPPHCDRGPQRG